LATADREDTMKAIVQSRYGPPREVLALEDVAEPAVGDDDVLVRVHAAAVNPADWHLIRGDPYIARLSFGLRGPRDSVPGCDLAGRVEAIGSAVTAFAPGDEVFGSPFMRGLGAFAERASVPHDVLAEKPANLSFEHSAALPVAALTALQGLRDHGQVGPGHRVLIVGASGGVGSFAVQIAGSLGAEVTGVCSTRNVDVVRSLGADHVIDYTEDDFSSAHERYDLILDIGGNASLSRLRRALTRRGTLVIVGGENGGRWTGGFGRQLRAVALSAFVRQRLVMKTPKEHYADLERLVDLIEAGKLTPAIGGTYPLDRAPDAMRHLQAGHARGKLVITVADDA
jgi:NADPH:quinone reductase-like Zn-dependent oxidoreductase